MTQLGTKNIHYHHQVPVTLAMVPQIPENIRYQTRKFEFGKDRGGRKLKKIPLRKVKHVKED